MTKTYLDIAIANESIVPVDIKGKSYSEVNQRIKAFRMVYPQGTIETKMLSNENGVCIFEAKVYSNPYKYTNTTIDGVITTDVQHQGILLGTGTAYEKEGSSFINKTSYIENAETSAVGRALGMAGFGIDVSVASAEEVQNAINNQEITQEEANNYKLTFGKYKDKTIKEVYSEDKKYIEWMINNTKDERMLKLIELATGIEIPTEEESKQRIELINDINSLILDTDTDYEELYKYFKIQSLNELTIAQLTECKMILTKKLNKKEK
jgi:hypothetical protein